MSLAKKGKIIKLYTTSMTNINAAAENMGRFTHFLFRVEGQGMSWADAAKEVRVAHFDYEDLTEVEQRLFKKIIPFYTWSRKNIPYQLQQMASRPGKYSAFPKIAFEMEAANEGGMKDIMPDWLVENMAFAFKGGSYFVPQFGVSDLIKLSDPTKITDMISPAFKIPMELMTGTSAFTGQKIDQGRKAPVSDIFGTFLKATGLGEMAGLEATSRKVGQDNIEATGVSPWAAYAASQIPGLNFFINQSSDVYQARRGSTELGGINIPNSFLNFFGGTSLWKVDNQVQLEHRKFEFEEEFAAYWKRLKDQGIVPQDPEEKESPYQQFLNRQLRKEYSRGG